MQQKGLSRDAIKYIAMLTMLLNHISTIFMQPGHLLSELFPGHRLFYRHHDVLFPGGGVPVHPLKKAVCPAAGDFRAALEIPYCLAMTEGGILEFCGMNMLFTLLLCFCILLVLDKGAKPGV